MILAAFGAIEGDAKTLQSVLASIDSEGIQTVVCTGDCAAGGADPGGVIRMLRERAIPIVQGHADRQLARFVRQRKRLANTLAPDALERMEHARRACGSEALEWLGSLPHERTITVDGERVVVFSGTIASPSTRLDAGDPDERFRRQREAAPANVFVFSNSGDAFQRHVDDAIYVNPGPVRSPGSSHGSYAVIDTEAGTLTARTTMVELP